MLLVFGLLAPPGSGADKPNKLGVDATVNGAAHKMELQFTNYQIKKQ